MSRQGHKTSPSHEATSAKPTAPERLDDILDHEIAPLAHAIWKERGEPEGTHLADWFEARRRLIEARNGNSSTVSEQAREAQESRQARDSGPTNRERMVDIGRGTQQAGRAEFHKETR